MINSNKNPLIFNPSSLILYSTLIFNLSSLIFLSCSKNSTNPDTVTFSGTVTLEDLTDHSGVKVSLYKPVELDTALVRINQQYPNIGVQISQETEFDHREHTPVKSTTTNASGSWKIEEVEAGTYNVVAEKDSFGWRCEHDMSSGNVNMSLKKAEWLNGIYSGSRTFNNAFIEIAGNTIFDEQSSIQLSGVNYIHFLDKYKLVIKGNFSTNSNIQTYFLGSNNVTGNVTFEQIENLKILNFFVLNNTQFSIIRSNVEVTNSRFKNKNSHAIRFNQTPTEVKSITVTGSIIGMIIDETTNLLIENSNLGLNDLDAEIFSCSDIIVKNTLFHDSNINLNLIAVNGQIINNEFKKSTENIYISDMSLITIKSNIFTTSETNIRTKYVSHQGNAIDLTINDNNFLMTNSWVIYLDHTTVSKKVDGGSNYWDTIQPAIVDDKIYDIKDDPTYNEFQEVEYIPILTTPSTSAGLE